MMLPGVELARRRRLHHGHEVLPARDLHEPAAVRRPSVSTEMDDSVIEARRRLEEKLRRFPAPPPPSSFSSLSSPLHGLIFSKARRGCFTNRLLSVDNETPVVDSNGGCKPRKGEIKSGSLKMELCAVCLDVLMVEQKVMQLRCSHAYHFDCLLPWLASQSRCPSCRTAVAS